MRLQSLILLALLLVTSGLIVGARIAASESPAISQATEPATPLMVMPTPAATFVAGSDWLTYTSPFWGLTFSYPPDWQISGPEVDYLRILDQETAQQSQARMLGVPLMLSSGNRNAGAITIILDGYTLAPGDSLAAWVRLKNELDGTTSFGSRPVELSAIPAKYLPAGIDQGILSSDGRRYNPQKVLWLEHNGLIYTVWTPFSRAEDLARLFAIIKTFTFDPQLETLLRQNAEFHEGIAALNQQLAALPPASTPECDSPCQDEGDSFANVVAPAATAKALPPLERPTAQPYSPLLPIGEDWLTYEQPVLGIRFRYPPHWVVNDAFQENNQDDSALLRSGVSLTPDQVGAQPALVIRLAPYVLGQDTPLSTWEAIRDQLRRAGQRDNTFNWPYRLFVPIDARYFPRQADDMIWANGIFISVNNVVYEIGGLTPETLPLAEAVLTTLEFDEAHLEMLRTMGIFAGDEQTMLAQLVKIWATPTPTLPPTATPEAPATATPSAFESPLVNDSQRYQGQSIYAGEPPYELWFNPTIWRLTANQAGSNYFVHQRLVGCEIGFYAPLESLALAPIHLAGYDWVISYGPTDTQENDAQGNVVTLIYDVNAGNSAYRFTLFLSEPLPPVYDPDNISQCQRDAQALLDSFAVVGEVSPASSLIPTRTPLPGQ